MGHSDIINCSYNFRIFAIWNLFHMMKTNFCKLDNKILSYD